MRKDGDLVLTNFTNSKLVQPEKLNNAAFDKHIVALALIFETF